MYYYNVYYYYYYYYYYDVPWGRVKKCLTCRLQWPISQRKVPIGLYLPRVMRVISFSSKFI